MDSESDSEGVGEPQAKRPKIMEKGINDLPPETRGQIYRLFTQAEITTLSQVCKQWKEEINNLYDHSLQIQVADQFPITKRCKECTVWSLIPTPNSEEPEEQFQLQPLNYPTFLQTLNIFCPVPHTLLQQILSVAVNLTKLDFYISAGFPTVLTLQNTPGLASLKNLKEISLVSDEEEQSSGTHFPDFPFFDCEFPKLETFYLYKRTKCRPLPFLQFLARHAPTLQSLSLYQSDEQEDPEQALEIVATDLDPNDLECLKSLQNMVELNVETTWTNYWDQILSQQSKLESLEFEIQERFEGLERSQFPWTNFVAPIQNSSETLKSVCLTEFSLLVRDHVRPFDLSIFKTCTRLEELSLDREDPEEEEVLSLINGAELPSSLLLLHITNFPMLSSDLEQMIIKCQNLRNLTLYCIGGTGNFGIISSVIIAMSSLRNLARLDACELNVSDPEEEQKLRTLVETLEAGSFDGQDTQIEFGGFREDEETHAHIVLERIQRLGQP